MLAVALHGQLLKVCGEALQVLLVGQHRHGLRIEEVVVPDDQQAHQHGQITFEGRGPEVLIHRVEASEHLAELLRTYRDHRGKADRRIHRIAPADPVPEAKHIGAVDAELLDLRAVGGDCDEVPRHRLLIAQRLKHPVARRVGVGHGFERREGLGADDEQGLLGTQAARRLDKVGAIHIRDETEGQVALAVILQSLVGHDGSEVGAANADVDYISNALAGVSLPCPAANLPGELRHLVEYGVNFGNDIRAIDEYLFALSERVRRHGERRSAR